jgi:serine/threonine protein kinase
MVGRYPILSKLGSGGQATVYRAVHPNLPVEVAIKRMHEQVDKQARLALKQEAHVLCDLDHPNIARVRDFDFDVGRPFMVMDLVRGPSLGQVAGSEPHNPSDAAVLVCKLAQAMQHAHDRGVIHRDLKPDNVVIDERGEPKIIDFGMSRIRSAMNIEEIPKSEISGTLVYMSPEQAIGDASKIDHRVDVFALGSILYRLLVGKAPYATTPLPQLLRTVQHGQWDRSALEAADAPLALKTICQRAMAMDVNERYASALELAIALDEYVAETTNKSHPGRGKLAIASVLGVLLVGSILFAVFIPGKQTSPTVSPSEDKLIQRFDLIHIGNGAARAEFSGPLLQYRPPRENDDIQVRAEFSQPTYCFLIALNPDGVKQLCYPAAADTAQTTPITSLRYPELEKDAFGLTDGAGKQAFVLVASRQPLPAYSQWNRELQELAWPEPEVQGNWVYELGELSALAIPGTNQLAGTRGKIRETKTPTPFKELCDRLQTTADTDVRGVLFEIEP